MRVFLNSISGLDDALVSLIMSKRSWTREKEEEIRGLVRENLTPEGFLKENHQLGDEIKKLIKYGIEFGHTTLLRYIDISVTVEGLHRGAQDDFDSHAARLNNRIVRSSTRLATFAQGEKSDYYKGKILFNEEACEIAGVTLPESVENNGIIYIKTDYGYINEKLVDSKDAKRGLYPLSIPSNFIFKVQYPELCHIVQHRDKNSGANPELKEMIEKLKTELTAKFPELGENLTKLKMQMYKGD